MGRLRRQERERVRRALLASAATHFAARGFAGANINQISVDAGFAKGTIYNYFSSKSVLFEAVLALGSARTVEDYRARAVEGDTRVHLQALAEADVALVRTHPAVMQTFVRELVAPGPRTRDVLLAGLAPLVEETAAIVRRGQQNGEVRREGSPARLASTFLGHLTMAYVQRWLRPEPDWDGLAEEVVVQFLDGAGLTSARR